MVKKPYTTMVIMSKSIRVRGISYVIKILTVRVRVRVGVIQIGLIIVI